MIKNMEQIKKDQEDKERLLQAMDEARDRAEAIIKEEDLYFLRDQNQVYSVKEHSFFTWAALYTDYRITSALEKSIFQDVMAEQMRMRSKIVNTFKKPDPRHYNMMSTGNWIQPVDDLETDYHEIFDVLFTSLSSGRPEVADHIIRCILWKYLHPEDYKLTALAFLGAQGAGKNLLVESLLATIFAGPSIELQQVVALGYKNVFGNFNGQLFGKVVVYVDESAAHKNDDEQLKQMIGNPTLTINEKNLKEIKVENTIWWILGTNSTGGPVKLAGRGDRRFSIIECTEDLKYWSEHFGHDIFWWYDNEPLLENREEVAKWLTAMLVKYADKMDRRPRSLHNEDYKAITELQPDVQLKNWVEEYLENSTDTFIETADIYRDYQIEWQRRGYAQNWIYNEVWFGRHMKAGIRERKLGWEKGYASGGGKRGWHRTDLNSKDDS